MSRDLTKSLVEDIESLKTIVKELAMELEMAILEKYAGSHEHPANIPRFKRDMALVNEANEMLKNLDGQF